MRRVHTALQQRHLGFRLGFSLLLGPLSVELSLRLLLLLEVLPPYPFEFRLHLGLSGANKHLKIKK